MKVPGYKRQEFEKTPQLPQLDIPTAPKEAFVQPNGADALASGLDMLAGKLEKVAEKRRENSLDQLSESLYNDYRNKMTDGFFSDEEEEYVDGAGNKQMRPKGLYRQKLGQASGLSARHKILHENIYFLVPERQYLACQVVEIQRRCAFGVIFEYSLSKFGCFP